ncbi:hypothetical protein PMZ80_007104 [Knufia obscura]|uniref:Large ribosomal subunit protein mL54 n=1 Tax=Knufia obscura TaxID=1635080 RepID=A0ABR0RK21_9EURO|nr:hypothetical protein PMZ80_007104 [Knufia obscura]
MICRSCRRTLLSRVSSLQSTSTTTSQPSLISHRTVATVPATKNAAPSTPPSSTTPAANGPAPAAISSSTPGATQPFSEPFFPSTTASTPPIAPSSPTPTPSAPKKLTSSVPGGTPLNMLTYVKQPPKPLLALEDTEYPPWLWSLVADPSVPTTVAGGIDTSTMTKKMRAKHERKQAKLAASMEKPIPLHEQSKDLVDLGRHEGAMEYAERRRELTSSMRNARRKGIREANFLRSM